MSLRAILRRTSKAVLPEFLLRRIKSIYYANAYRDFDEAREPDLAIVKKLVRAGDRVIDIGANVGLYTVTLSRLVGSSGKVYSYEPIPETYKTLVSVVMKLCLENVETRGCALSDSQGQGSMEVPMYDEGGENLYQARLVSGVAGPRKLCSVELCTLDSLFGNQDNKKIDFVKIDVEGHELQVIKGGRRVIEQCKPLLLIELSGDPDDSKSASFALVEELRRMGYVAYWFDGKRLRARVKGDASVNYFFFMPNHIEKFSDGGFVISSETSAA